MILSSSNWEEEKKTESSRASLSQIRFDVVERRISKGVKVSGFESHARWDSYRFPGILSRVTAGNDPKDIRALVTMKKKKLHDELRLRLHV